MKRVLSLALAVVLAAMASGCGSAPDETTEPVAPKAPAPPGMISAKDAGKLQEGTAIYAENGDKIGVIKSYEDDHKFPDGKVERGVLIETSSGVEEWKPASVVEDAFLIQQ